MKTWDNGGMCVFVVRDEGPPEYLSCTGISNIEWSMTEEGVCQYCGSAMEGNRCLGCGGVVGEHSLGQAVVTLEGVLPQATPIFHLPEGAELLLCYKCRGDRRCFEAEEVIMRFLRCHQVAKSLPNAAALYPEQRERLRLFVSVECDVELYPDGMESI